MDPADFASGRSGDTRILVTRLRYLGDIILTTPVIEALHSCFPGAEIWYMAEPPYASMLENNPGLAGVIEAGRGIPAMLGTVKRLRSLKFSVAIDLFYNPRSANILRLSGIPVRIGGGRKWRRRLYTDIFKPDRRIRSAIEHHLAALAPLGCEAQVSPPRVYLTEAELEGGRSAIASVLGDRRPGRTVAFHAGGTWPAKRWPAGSFASLSNAVLERYGARALLVSGPGEEEISSSVVSASGGSARALPVMPIRYAAATIAACGALVSNDGGVMHTGVALGVPTVGIFGPTEPDIWFPYSGMGPYEVITRNEDCAPCHLHECEDMKCLENITVDEVTDALGRVTGWPA